MKWTRIDDQVFTTIASKTVTYVATANQKNFFGYCFTGTGLSSNNLLWNNGVAASGQGYHVAPTLATDNVQIGALTTVTVPANTLGACTLDANKTFNDLTIKSTSSLIINVGKQLTVDTLYKENAAATALTLKSNATGTASLLNNTAGITATIERYIPSWLISSGGYHLLSSPVTAQLIAPNFVESDTLHYDFYKWDVAANIWRNQKQIVNNITTFTPGVGYLASYYTTSTHIFSGTLNALDLSPTLVYNSAAKYNLIGNPYPCALNGDIRTWTRPNVGQSVYVLDSSNHYLAWNGLTGFIGSPDGISIGNGQIPAMQGFWVMATGATPSITIPASAKTHSSNNFYKTTIDNQLVISVKSPNNTSDAAIIYFKDENSNDVDNYDAMLMPSANPLNTQIYSYINNSDKYSIDALATYTGPYTVNVGFEPKVDGNFTITAGDIQSFNTNSTITLVDLVANTTQNLRSNPTYTFTANTATDPVNRFKIVFDLVVGINNVNAVANAVYSFDNSIYIKTTEKVKSVSVFNMLGQEVENIQQPTSNVLTLHQATGYYTVRVITEANVYSQKVYIK